MAYKSVTFEDKQVLTHKDMNNIISGIDELRAEKKPMSIDLNIPKGLKIALLGASTSTKLGRNAVEITVEPEDVGVELSAYATYYDIGTTIGGYKVTSSDVGKELTFTPTSSDIGKQMGKVKTYAGNNNIKTWWEILEEQLDCEFIPVCWSGSGTSSHEESKAEYKCIHAFHDSQIRKCGIRTPGTMDRTAPDLVILWRAGNDVTHEPYCTITENYFDDPHWHYPDTDLKEDGTYGALEAIAVTVKKLRAAYPFTPIVIGTMCFIKRVDCDNFPVTNGLYSFPYYNTHVRKAADFFGIQTIDFDKVNITFENIYPTYANDSAKNPTHATALGHELYAAQALKDLVTKCGDIFQFKINAGTVSLSDFTNLPYRVYSTTNVSTGINASLAEDMVLVSNFKYKAPENASCTIQSPMGASGGFFALIDVATKTIYNNQNNGTYQLQEGHDYFIKLILDSGAKTVTTSLYDGADDTLSTPLDTISRSVSNVSYPICVGNTYIASSTGYDNYRYSGLESKLFEIYQPDGNLIFSGVPVQRNSDGVYGVYDSVSRKFFPEKEIKI